MQLRNLAALGLILSSSIGAQTISDLSNATPVEGRWDYSTGGISSDARFSDARGMPQLVIHCDRAVQRVSVSLPTQEPAAYLSVWTSAQSRSLPARFDSVTGRLSSELERNDSLLDALSNSRGRIGVRAGNRLPLVVPAWPEIARVVEDCRG